VPRHLFGRSGFALLLYVCAIAAQAAEAPAARTVYLIRHGAYLPDSKADPAQGPGITPLGVAQARLVAGRLDEMPVRFDSMTSSTMMRARETAAVMHETLAEVPFAESALLAECTPVTSIELQGQSVAEQAACAQRLDAAFAKFFAPAAGAERHDVLVAHGNVIRYFVAKSLRVDPRAWVGMSVAHASLTTVRVLPDGSYTVSSVGDVGHIPDNLQSWGTAADRQLVAPPPKQ
jgi:serine/threonine-protein phosphatase PGAM5